MQEVGGQHAFEALPRERQQQIAAQLQQQLPQQQQMAMRTLPRDQLMHVLGLYYQARIMGAGGAVPGGGMAAGGPQPMGPAGWVASPPAMLMQGEMPGLSAQQAATAPIQQGQVLQHQLPGQQVQGPELEPLPAPQQQAPGGAAQRPQQQQQQRPAPAPRTLFSQLPPAEQVLVACKFMAQLPAEQQAVICALSPELRTDLLTQFHQRAGPEGAAAAAAAAAEGQSRQEAVPAVVSGCQQQPQGPQQARQQAQQEAQQVQQQQAGSGPAGMPLPAVLPAVGSLAQGAPPPALPLPPHMLGPWPGFAAMPPLWGLPTVTQIPGGVLGVPGLPYATGMLGGALGAPGLAHAAGGLGGALGVAASNANCVQPGGGSSQAAVAKAQLQRAQQSGVENAPPARR